MLSLDPDMEEDCLESLNRSIKSLNETCETSLETLEKLDKQGNKINSIQEKVGIINEFQDKADKHIRTIKSMLGVTVNTIVEYTLPIKWTLSRWFYYQDVQPIQYVQQQQIEDNATSVDDGLNKLGTLLGQLKHTQIEINHEIDRHNNQLQNLHDHVEYTSDRIERQTEQIKKLK